MMKPPQSLPLQMAERLLRAQPDSVANHVTACSIDHARSMIDVQSCDRAIDVQIQHDWLPAPAGKAKTGMVHSVSGRTRGVQVKL